MGEIADGCKWGERGVNEARERAPPSTKKGIRRNAKSHHSKREENKRMKKGVKKGEKTHEVNDGPLVDEKAKSRMNGIVRDGDHSLPP